MSFLFWALKAKDAVETAIFWKRFKAWQAERDARLAAEKASKPPSVPLVMIAIVAAVMSTAATCGKQIVKDTADLQIYCCVEHPDECRNLPITIPCPATPRPTATPTIAPTFPPSPTAAQTAIPTPTLAATATPLPTATLAPTATPTPDCAPRPGPQPISIAYPKRCPVGMREVAFFGEPGVTPPAGYAELCGANICGGGYAPDGTAYYPNDCTWWRIGDGLHHGNSLQLVAGAYVKHEVLGTGTEVCVDAIGRRYDNCERLYPVGPLEYFPDGTKGPWTSLGYPVPTFCGDPTPAPQPTDPPTAGDACVLPPGTGDGVDCPREARGAHLPAVEAAINLVREHRAEWFTADSAAVRPGRENPFRWDVVQELRARGLCAFFDGEEVAVKGSNDFSEQYHILASDGRVRSGEQSYRATCRPAWSAVPATDTARPPALAKLKAGDRCINPKDGPRYRRGECVIDNSGIYRDPEHVEDNTRDSVCDPDHLGWRTFCHEQPWLDPRGLRVEVRGATFAGPDGSNPYWSVITGWVEGQPLDYCVSPLPDAPWPVLDAGPDCKRVTP